MLELNGTYLEYIKVTFEKTCEMDAVASHLYKWLLLTASCHTLEINEFWFYEVKIEGQPENSLHQERTHAEWFTHSKCSEQHWWLKPEVSWVQLTATASFFAFLFAS